MAGSFAGRSGLSRLFTASNGRRTQTRRGLGLHHLVFELVNHASYLHGLREVRNIRGLRIGFCGVPGTPAVMLIVTNDLLAQAPPPGVEVGAR